MATWSFCIATTGRLCHAQHNRERQRIYVGKVGQYLQLCQECQRLFGSKHKPGTSIVSQNQSPMHLPPSFDTEFRSHACDRSNNAAFDVKHELAVNIAVIVS